MQILVNIDDLRQLATLSAEAAESMTDANNVISTVVSKHDWKCPERVNVDEMLETLKKNSVALNQVFTEFSNDLIKTANSYTDFANDCERDKLTYMEDVMSRLSGFSFGNMPKTVNSGCNIAETVSTLEASSTDLTNISSLHGSAQAISIIDFSLFNTL